MTHVYVPATLHLLALLERHRALPMGDDVVVVPADVEDPEAVEYDALMTAAESSAVLVAELDEGERRRVVVVAEVAALSDALDPADTLDLADVVAVHADAEDLRADADPDDLEDLGWYAVQEIPDLLEGRLEGRLEG
jgi:hypothetical protein